MRASIFTIPPGVASSGYTVNAPGASYAAVTLNIIGAVNTTTPLVNVTGGQTQAQMNAYVGQTVTFFGGTATVEAVGTITAAGSVLECRLTLSASTSTGITISFPAVTTPGGLVAGVTSIPLNTTSGLVIGDTITGTGIAIGTTVVAVNSTTNTITISRATTAALANGANITEPAQPGYLVYPVDQYVAPVELSIQPIDAGGQVGVQASVLPLSEIDGPNATWGTYNSDAGSATLGTSGTVNTYSGKVVTAVRFVNNGPACRVALAEAGIIS